MTNEVRISGRAVKDAVRNGNGPYRFSIACDSGKKSTEFFSIVWWSERGTQVKKGAELQIVGRLHQSSWEKNGEKFSRVEVVANDVSGPSIEGNTPAPPLPPLTPKFPVPTRGPRDYKVAETRPVTPTDPITDLDIGF